MIVADSSGIVDFLLESAPRAAWVLDRIEADPNLHAPYLVDVEVVATLRREVLRGVLSAGRARTALDDFLGLAIRRYPHAPLLPRVWALRQNLTTADALFVALAEALDAPLITTDARLGRAPGVGAEIIAFPG